MGEWVETHRGLLGPEECDFSRHSANAGLVQSSERSDAGSARPAGRRGGSRGCPRPRAGGRQSEVAVPGHHESRNQNAEDALEIEDVCHTLKSSSASVGARALTTMCKE